jgi:hypothetical protein
VSAPLSGSGSNHVQDALLQRGRYFVHLDPRRQLDSPEYCLTEKLAKTNICAIRMLSVGGDGLYNKCFRHRGYLDAFGVESG